MPAVDLMRLRQQVARLAEFFFLPSEFVQHLHRLLEAYHNPTWRPTQVSTPFALPSYRLSPIVLRIIEQSLRDLAASYPEYALDLADALWKEGVLEMRQLAAFLLGQVPAREEWLLPRLTAWSNQVQDVALRFSLLENGLRRLRREAPRAFLSLIAEWLHPERPNLWENGLQALLPLLDEGGFENFPELFSLLRPVLENAPPLLQNEIGQVLQRLFQRLPQETLFTLQRWLEENPSSHLRRSLRQALPVLPASSQPLVRSLLLAP